jgi:hypothetical protein
MIRNGQTSEGTAILSTSHPPLRCMIQEAGKGSSRTYVNRHAAFLIQQRIAACQCPRVSIGTTGAACSPETVLLRFGVVCLLSLSNPLCTDKETVHFGSLFRQPESDKPNVVLLFGMLSSIRQGKCERNWCVRHESAQNVESA